jgi:large subunit ribosomal protein L9
MQVILTQNVAHVGALGDMVAVKDGFARNYLLPRGMAIVADSKNAREIQHRRKRLEQLRLEAIDAARAESERVQSIQIVLKAKAGAGGKLFGSVTSRDLQLAYAEQGVTLDRKLFVLHSLIKHTGTFSATVRLHTDVKVDVSFKVESMDLTPEEQAAIAAEEAQAAAAKAANKARDEAKAEVDAAAARVAEGAAKVGKKSRTKGDGEDAAAEGDAKPAKKAKGKGDGAGAEATGKAAKADAGEKPKGKGKKKD